MSGEKGVRSAVRPVNCFEVLLKVMEALLEKKENSRLWAMGYSSKISVLSSNAPLQCMHVSLHTMIADGRTDFFDHCLCGLMAKAHPS